VNCVILAYSSGPGYL